MRNFPLRWERGMAGYQISSGLGGGLLDGSRPAPRGSPPASILSYGLLSAASPSNDELAELRRQQAAQAGIRRKLDVDNSWLALPVLAAPLAVGGLEGAIAWAAQRSPPASDGEPLQFIDREPRLRGGDNWSTRAGRRAHAWLEDKVDAKDGWESEPDVLRPGLRPLKPDVGTPIRDPKFPERRYYLELKPNTPTGRAAAARAVTRYKNATKQKVRPIFYNPEDFM